MMLSLYDNIVFMKMRTRIQEVAHERGRTVMELARQLGLYRSNLSAMDAGRRTPSLRLLARISEALGCSVGDLVEVHHGPEAPVFRKASLERRVRERIQEACDGTDKGWTHAVLLAWQRHYRSKGSRKP